MLLPERSFSKTRVSAAQSIKLERVTNFNIAKQIGLKTPPEVLARADRVIK
jgi:hypothetical protein